MTETHIVVLCSECKDVPIALSLRMGDARTWDGILFCRACAERLGAKVRQEWRRTELSVEVSNDRDL